jgi:hypothetical protein
MKYLTILKQAGMNPVQVLLVSIIGGFAIYIAYLPVFHDTLFFTWINYVPFFCLCTLTILYFFLSTIQFIKAKKILKFLPVVIGAICIFVIIMQNRKRKSWDNASIIFTAHTQEIGSDGGLDLDFKSNGILKATKMDHWAVTEYWGTYNINKDTINLDIPFDFRLGQRAILEKNSLRFLDDTIHFEALRFNL